MWEPGFIEALPFWGALDLFPVLLLGPEGRQKLLCDLSPSCSLHVSKALKMALKITRCKLMKIRTFKIKVQVIYECGREK